jgi:hypothetical protein
MKLSRKLNKTSRALWIILLTGICAPVWAIPASSIILRYVDQYEIPKNFFTLFVVFSIPVYIGAFSDQFVEWLWKGFRKGGKKSGPISRIKTVICFCILGLTLFVGVPLAIVSVKNF